MEGIERLEQEVLEMNDSNVSAIYEYLKTKNILNNEFNNQEKSIRQMYEFICKKAENIAKNNIAMVHGNLVYIWAITYFKKSNKELGIEKKKETITTISKEQETKKKEEKDKKTKNTQITLFKEE